MIPAVVQRRDRLKSLMPEKGGTGSPVMIDKNTEALLRQLIEVCEGLSNAEYSKADELFELTKTGAYPGVVTELAEIFGMMMMKVESREFRLSTMVEDLKVSHEKLEGLFRGSVFALASAIEKRDPYTAGHQQRVAKIAVAIAEEMNLPANEREGIRVGGALHDIGKIYLPAEILCRPTGLTDIEFSFIKTHSQVGCDILKSVEFPWPVALIALQHHEKMNGSGYPQGLKGAEILQSARIVCVADVVEAMSSHRPYRPALGQPKALDEISKNSGMYYDPDAVGACQRLMTRGDLKLDE